MRWLDHCGTPPVHYDEHDAVAPPGREAEETCSGCGYCEPARDLHCPKCCDLGFPF
jgi:hypothetical protein